MHPLSPPSSGLPIHKRLHELGAAPPRSMHGGSTSQSARRKREDVPQPDLTPAGKVKVEDKSQPPRFNQHGQDSVQNIIQAFFSMSPALAVDLFTNERRETNQDVVSIGTQLWLETTFKQKVLRIDWTIFTEAQLAALRTLAAFTTDQNASRTIVTKLKQAEWFQSAFVPLFGDVAGDMFNMYFRRDNQIRWTPQAERAWQEQDHQYRNATRGNQRVPVLRPGDPGYDEADIEELSSDSDGEKADAMDIDVSKPLNRAFGS